MKTGVLTAIMLCLSISSMISADSTNRSTEEHTSVQLAASLISHDLDGLFISQFQAGIMPSCIIDNRTILSLPVLYTYQNDSGAWMLDVSGNISYYPKGRNLWIGMSVLQNILLFGDMDENEEHLMMHEMFLGYSFRLGERLFISPCLVIRDPFQRYQEEMEVLQEFFPSYARIELGIHIRGIAAEIQSAL